MPSTISPIITPQQLLPLISTKAIILIDARAAGNAKERYDAMHLEGALHADLESQLAAVPENAANGGRHPLPDPKQFTQVLTGLGIRPESHVVVYDDKNGSNAAARFWWMLRAAGHENVQVLDGGFDAAIAAGVPTSTKQENPVLGQPYEFSAWLLPLADLQEVEKVAQDDRFLVIDVRDAARFRGEVEPIDTVAGHIPGATNIPFSSNLDREGFYLSPAELREKYLKALNGRKPEEVIVHCGSGVTACHTLLAMAYADLEIPKLYVGSWSEWSRNDKPIGKGEA